MLWRRRELLRSGAAVVALSGPAGILMGPRARGESDVVSRVLPLPVASGDPTGAVVWTRIAAEARTAGRDLVLEVASDAG